ncbi:ankyrin repeat domain-containing protein [Labedaea rhizosphaerae]|uniref:Ankyrin repeat protein n=1 Tax=Labedaea rhizosphaerae TaxID=598644 RepID=A0A4R6SEC4_LABRH|nr:ankyrin repeat domain-containing protein [Labedaea rhizosphaerae]TDP98064.1 ankyrin repeat protein [Labedaea rhizosphaerae]
MDLGQLRKQAKERVRATPSLKLADAQHAIAREHGFPSWPRLKAYVERSGVQQPFRGDLDYYAERAYGLLASAQDGTPSAVAEFTRLGQPLSRAGARAVVARRHGFSGWQALAHHLRGLDAEPFARAFRLIEARDVEGLAAHLDRFPELVSRKGTNGNDLLGLAASTCDERLVRIVLERGADPAAANAHGWTALHQAGYSNLPWMARLLLDAGAPPDVHGRGDGGTPLVVALFWGHREVAAVLAERSLAPGNLRVAAGLDRVDLLPTATADHRGFYRPHSGFPAWTPGDSVQEARDEALAWAARNGATQAMDWLVRHGARPNADVYRGTPLIWAACRARDEAVRWLLDHGADVNQRATFGGPQHGQGVTALHMAAESDHRSTVEILLAAGADRTLTDDLYNATPGGWAEFNGHPELAHLLS